MNRELRLTADGSSTIFVPALDEHYHSIHGARQESAHVFIAAGLNNRHESSISILEIGFGTGLNAFLTALEAQKKGVTIFYTGLEKYPVSTAEAAHLNYAKGALDSPESSLFKALHLAPWETETPINTHFILLKRQIDFLEFKAEEAFHLIYFDAFAPSAQPDLWTVEMFQSMFSALKKGGELVTYCAKGQVKRNMKTAGFIVDALPGPPGKREMTRATKP